MKANTKIFEHLTETIQDEILLKEVELINNN
jgi:hypothetical protein